MRDMMGLCANGRRFDHTWLVITLASVWIHCPLPRPAHSRLLNHKRELWFEMLGTKGFHQRIWVSAPTAAYATLRLFAAANDENTLCLSVTIRTVAAELGWDSKKHTAVYPIDIRAHRKSHSMPVIDNPTVDLGCACHRLSLYTDI